MQCQVCQDGNGDGGNDSFPKILPLRNPVTDGKVGKAVNPVKNLLAGFVDYPCAAFGNQAIRNQFGYIKLWPELLLETQSKQKPLFTVRQVNAIHQNHPFLSESRWGTHLK